MRLSLVPMAWTVPGLGCLNGILAAEPAAAPTMGECPPPGKADTFAQDTWQRRNKCPLRIVLMETEGKDAKDVPMTLSVACGEGDYPAGQLTPVLDGKALPAQADVLATSPKDGSAGHALVSLVLPGGGRSAGTATTQQERWPCEKPGSCSSSS